MGAIIVVLGLGWLIYTFCKEEICTKQIPKGTDFRQSFLDSNHISGKELDKRLRSGYYVKKDK